MLPRVQARIEASDRRRLADRLTAALVTVAACLLVGMASRPLIGQAASNAVVGEVRQIKRVRAGSSCNSADQQPVAGTAMWLGDGTSARPLSAAPPPQAVRLGETIRVLKSFDARLTIADTVFGLGDIVLAPQLLCRMIGADTTVGIQVADSGLYDMQRRADTLVFTARRGAAYFQWRNISKRCRLQIIAVRVTSQVCGTRIVLAVDSLERTALMYIVDGVVSFPDSPGVTARTGQLFVLGSGPPRLVSAVQTHEVIDRHRIDYHSADIWKPPPSLFGRVIRSPWTYGVVGVAAGVVTWKIVDSDEGSNPTKKKVVVRIPF